MADDSVFFAIRALPWAQLTETVYLLLLVLRQRSHFDDQGMKAMLDAAAAGGPADTDGSLRKLVDATVQAITKAEKKSLSEIPESEIDKYRQLLSGLLSEHGHADISKSTVSGAELLKQLHTRNAGAQVSGVN